MPDVPGHKEAPGQPDDGKTHQKGNVMCMHKKARNQGKGHDGTQNNLGRSRAKHLLLNSQYLSSGNSIKSCKFICTLQVNIHLPATPIQSQVIRVSSKGSFAGLNQESAGL